METNLNAQTYHRILEAKYYNNTTDVAFVIKVPVERINEASEDQFVPRFKVHQKAHQIFNEFPINKQLKFSQALMIKAISYGMILLVQYRGEEDQFAQGHTRVIYPMVIGKSKKGSPLLRGYHLKGWSVSQSGNVDKVWRMFRTDRILSMSFTGSFFRLPPAGYNMLDKGMKGGIIKAAEFNSIRRNQTDLMKKDIIQYKQETEFDKVTSVYLDDSSTKLDLKKPFDNPNIDKKQQDLLRFSFLKKTTSNERIAILGAMGKRGNNVKIYINGKYEGIYNVERSFMGPMLEKPGAQNISGVTEFPLYIYLNKK